MKKIGLIFVCLTVLMACNPVKNQEGDPPPVVTEVVNYKTMGYSYDIPTNLIEEQADGKGKFGGMTITPLKRYVNDGMVLNVSFVQKQEGIETSIDDYFQALKDHFSDKEPHTALSSVHDMETFVIRFIDENLLIVKVLFYEEIRGYLQFDFICSLLNTDQNMGTIEQILFSVR